MECVCVFCDTAHIETVKWSRRNRNEAELTDNKIDARPVNSHISLESSGDERLLAMRQNRAFWRMFAVYSTNANAYRIQRRALTHVRTLPVVPSLSNRHESCRITDEIERIRISDFLHDEHIFGRQASQRGKRNTFPCQNVLSAQFTATRRRIKMGATPSSNKFHG